MVRKIEAGMIWLLAAVALVGAVVVGWMTGPYGLGLGPDSVSHLQAARFLDLGQGLSFYGSAGVLTPVLDRAPAFPVLLSGAWFLGLSFAEWARLLNITFFFASLFMGGITVLYVTRDQRAALAATGLLLLTPQVLEVHGQLVCEPMFLALFTGMLLALAIFMETGSRRALYLFAFLVGLGAVTRYAGVALLITGAWWLLGNGRDGMRRRNVLFFLVVAGFLPFLFYVRNAALGSSGMTFFSSVGAMFPVKMGMFIDLFSQWMLPARVPALLRWAVLGLVIGAFWGALLRFPVKHGPAAGRLLRFLAGAGVIYLAVVWLVSVFGGQDFYPSRRLLAPFFAGAAIAAGLWVPMLMSPWTLRRKAAAAVLVIFGLLGLARGVQVAYVFHEKGEGYSSKAVTGSKLAETLRSLDDRVPLYSNDPQALYYFANRSAIRIPEAGEDVSFLPPLPVMAKDFLERRAVAVVFERGSFQPADAWKEMADVVGMEVLMKDAAGNILGVRRR